MRNGVAEIQVKTLEGSKATATGTPVAYKMWQFLTEQGSLGFFLGTFGNATASDLLAQGHRRNPREAGVQTRISQLFCKSTTVPFPSIKLSGSFFRGTHKLKQTEIQLRD